MEATAFAILGSGRIMAISTVRPDGWPQTTIVGYANIGFDIYFMIFRSSQKFANIQLDNRVSFAIGGEARDLSEARAVFAGAHATEVTDPMERARAWEMLVQRHPNLRGFEPPEGTDAVMMRARCEYVSIVDYTKGLGHTESLTLSDG